jgi:hypothetical protein
MCVSPQLRGRFRAAWVVSQAIEDVTYVKGVYGKTELPDELVKGREILFVDFSVKRDEMERIARLARKVMAF